MRKGVSGVVQSGLSKGFVAGRAAGAGAAVGFAGAAGCCAVTAHAMSTAPLTIHAVQACRMPESIPIPAPTGRSAAPVQHAPALVGDDQLGLERVEARQRVADRIGRLLVEVGTGHAGAQRLAFAL